MVTDRAACQRPYAGPYLSIIKGAVLVPAQAVQRGPDGDFVYRVRGDKAEPVAVSGNPSDTIFKFTPRDVSP